MAIPMSAAEKKNSDLPLLTAGERKEIEDDEFFVTLRSREDSEEQKPNNVSKSSSNREEYSQKDFGFKFNTQFWLNHSSIISSENKK